MDTKKLRQKILDLAIRGKLVPQDPNDEPASVLLERIRAEKEQLIKEGKIKRSKKSAASDTSHYENVPYKIPSNWCWTTIGELFYLQAGKFINASEITDCKDDLHSYPCYGGNGLRGYVTTYNRNGLFPIIGRQGALCGNINVAEGKFYATEHAVVVETFASVDVKVFVYFLMQLNLNQYATATAQPGLAVKTINEVPIPLPPLNEQYRISHAIEKAFNKMSIIDESKYSLCMGIQQFKAGVLDIAISGKLVPQDSSDEPAIELLKRINPDFVSCDNRHYENVPPGWAVCTFEDILDYEQPQKYIVSSTEYSDAYKIPVLTAGKSFIIGKTNENFGICERLPVIIFDDFTTGSKYVDFPFKVKSSAMKILRVKGNINPRYISYLMSITRLVGETHKRYWISEYRKIKIMLPPIEEQNRIVTVIENIYNGLDNILAEL